MQVWGKSWECVTCGRKSDILAVYFWRPPGIYRERFPQGMWSVRAKCFDRPACRARREKRRDRASVRASRITITTPPGNPKERAKPGNCCWCGGPMTRKNKAGEVVPDRRRSYHRAEHGERDCRAEVDASYTFDARIAIRRVARLAGDTELRCVDCDALCEHLTDEFNGEGCVMWEADHELALEDGGEHALENLRARCCPCHRSKTGRENAARAAARRPPSRQLAIETA